MEKEENLSKKICVMGNLYADLAKAQGEFKEVTKDKEVTVTMKSGGSYKYSYATASEIRRCTQAALSKYGLALIQQLVEGEQYASLVTLLAHKDGGEIKSEIKINTNINDPKALGALITYYRRYAISGVLNISADDEDDKSLEAHTAAQAMQRREAPIFNEKSPVTQPQLRWLADLAKKNSWTIEQVKVASEEMFGIPDVKRINGGQFQEIIKAVQGGDFDAWKMAHDLVKFNNEPEPEF